jgi:hypothetical protein
MNIGDVYIRECKDDSYLIYRIHKIGIRTDYVSYECIGTGSKIRSMSIRRRNQLLYMHKEEFSKYFKVDSRISSVIFGNDIKY